MLHILIACNHIISREKLLCSLSDPQLPCALCLCADIYAAISLCGQQQPDIVVIDGSCDPLAAIEATKKITSTSATNIIAFSRQPDPAFARHMLAAGALGYLNSNVSCDQVIAAVQEVAKDNLYNCLNNQPIPLPTPARVAPILRSIAAFGKNTREQMRTATEIHWHGIFKFTN